MSLNGAVFLDRDGVLIEENGYIASIEQIKFIENSHEAIKLINRLNLYCIIITNQPVVARGEANEDDINKIHDYIKKYYSNKDAYIDAIYYCPHHPDRGFKGENVRYKMVCDCRKPNIGLITEAINHYNIDVTKSFMIGDTTTDIQTGINSGCKTILVKTGHAGMDQKYDVIPDYVCLDVYNSIKLINTLL